MNKNNKLKKICFFAMSCAFFSTSSVAAPYVSGQLGISSPQDTNHVYKSGRLGAGYLWDVKRRLDLGVEGAYQYDEKITDDNNITYHSYDFDLLGVLNFHLAKKFNAFFKIGPTCISPHLNRST